ncbi:MAG: glycosyltransferase [Bacteroidales bacterium]|nr:glycosyltransferase [Bacteroidales bacterium]
MKRIIISVTNDLVSDNRVHKVATSLQNSGFEVFLVGRKLKNSPEISRKYKTHRIRLIFNKSVLFYAEFNFRLFLFLFFHKVDILLSNDLDTLLPNFFVSSLKNRKLVYDSHELFTEVPELIERPKVQKIWLKIERFCLPKIKYSYTVCQSISDYYKEKYGIEMGVVRNIPFCEKIEKLTIQHDNKILLYQGAVNIGRGLEEAVEAMQFLEGFELWIIGGGDIENQLKTRVKDLNLEEKVKILGRKKLEELAEYTNQADLGLSIEKNMGLNYYFALPNKIFDYIQAEIPILCSDLPEMSRIIKNYNIGAILESHEPKKVAIQIKLIFENKSQFEIWTDNLKVAKKELCWQNEEKILLTYFGNFGSNS